MIVLLDTSTPLCHVELVDGTGRYTAQWEAGRSLAKGLLRYLDEQLAARGKDWRDATGIGVMRGPGSFTGLRIGLAVMNTIADSQRIPIVGVTGDGWQDEALRRLEAGENDQVVLPLYGSEANITSPRK